MKNEIVYWEDRLKDLNKTLLDLHIEKRNAQKQLQRLTGREGSPYKRENKKQRSIKEFIFYLQQRPNQSIPTSELLHHLRTEINCSWHTISPLYREAQLIDPAIVQVFRGYYMYRTSESK